MKLLRAKTKLLVLFFVTVAVPSLILAYLSFRGIQSDRAAAEQELLVRHEGIAQSIVNLIEEELDRTELTMEDLLIHEGQRDQPDLRSMAQRLRLSSPLVAEPFIVRRAEVVFPLATRLFCKASDTHVIPASLSSVESDESCSRAVQLEFQTHDFEGAALAYAEALNDVASPKNRVEILFARARVLKRTERKREAREVYEEIVRRYKGLSIAGGIPVELAARLELLKDTQPEGGRVQTAGEIVQLYDELLDETWSLTRVQSEFIIDRLRGAWSSLSAAAGGLPSALDERFREVEERVRSSIEPSQKLVLLESRILTDLLRPDGLGQKSNSYGRRHLGIMDSLTSPIVVVPSKAGNPKGISMIGALLKTDGDLSGVSSLLEKITLPSNTLVRVANESGDRVAGSVLPKTARKTVERRFPGGVPSWTINLYHQDPAFFEQLLTSRRRVYVLALVLAVGVLTFGSILTLRMISREVELARLQGNFVSTVSHELRSPLTSIRQLSEMLQRGRIPSEERRQRYYDTMVEQSERLSLLVENILDFARFEEGRKVFHFEEADLRNFLTEVVSRVQHQVQHEGFTISLEIAEDLPPARIDRDAVAQGLVNLLDNAIKFSGKSREVKVAAYRDDGFHVIDVVDQGIGIRQDDIKRVFDRFYRGSTEEVLATRGTGLGLTIVKYVVEGHGGTIAVQSEPGCGSTFTIKLPITGAQNHALGTHSHHRG